MNAAPSYVHGGSSQPLLGDTLGSLIDRIAAAHPERPALVVRAQHVRMSYRQFHAEVERVAAGLLALGCSVAIASASGRRTGPSGWCCNSRRRRPG